MQITKLITTQIGRILVLLLPLMLSTQLAAQDLQFMPKPEKCGEVYVDPLAGQINGFGLDADYRAVRKSFIDCTEAIDAMERRVDGEEALSNSVGFRFFFGYSELQVWKGFKGKTSFPVFGKKPAKLDEKLGAPEISGNYHRLYKTAYGTLYVGLDKKKRVEFLSMHATPVNETWELLCMDSGYCR